MAKTDEDKEFESDILGFMKKYAIYPTDYTGDVPGLYDKSTKTTNLDDLLTVKDRKSQIAYTKSERIPFNSYSGKKNAFKLVFLPPSAVVGKEDDHVAVWFLPWANNRMTAITLPPKIPARPDRATTTRVDPDIFFTAAINGCSVFVHGDPKTPTVTHGGTEDPRSSKFGDIVPVPGSLTEKQYVPNDTHFKHGNARLHWTGLHQKHFGNPGPAAIHTGDYKNYLGTGNTREAVEYEKFLKDNTGKLLRIEQVEAQGCVFGRRGSDGSWAFFLQKNIEVVVTKLRKKKHFIGKNEYLPKEVQTGMKKKWVGDVLTDVPEMSEQKVNISIPISVVEFFPGPKVSMGSAILDPSTVKMMVEQAIG